MKRGISEAKSSRSSVLNTRTRSHPTGTSRYTRFCVLQYFLDWIDEMIAMILPLRLRIPRLAGLLLSMSFASVARSLKRQDGQMKVGYYRTFSFAREIQIRNFSPCAPNVWQSVGHSLHAPYCQRPMVFLVTRSGRCCQNIMRIQCRDGEVGFLRRPSNSPLPSISL